MVGKQKMKWNILNITTEKNVTINQEKNVNCRALWVCSGRSTVKCERHGQTHGRLV